MQLPRKPFYPASAMFNTRPSQMGSTATGFVLGLLVGLLVALGAALFVTKAPLPFVTKSKEVDKQIVPPSEADLPDPNRTLIPKSEVKADSPLELKPDTRVPASPADPAALLNGTASAVKSPGKPADAPVAGAPGPYFLQAGSFKGQDEAEQLRARLALAGIESNIVQAEVDGKAVNRVRIGPFASADEAYRARTRLTENGFDARLVKAGQ